MSLMVCSCEAKLETDNCCLLFKRSNVLISRDYIKVFLPALTDRPPSRNICRCYHRYFVFSESISGRLGLGDSHITWFDDYISVA